MKKVTDKITVAELKKMSEKMYGGLVKAVVDLSQKIILVDASMHADQEKVFLEEGAKQQDLWGINLYPDMFGDEDFIEFDSMINIRPHQNNRSRGVESEEIREQIKQLVNNMVTEE
jgi:hypothetical protein